MEKISRQKGHELRPRGQNSSKDICTRNSVCTATLGGQSSDRISFTFEKVHADSRVIDGFKKNEAGVQETSWGHFSTGFQVRYD